MKSSIALLATVATAVLVSSCSSPSGTAADGHTDHTHASASSAAAPNNPADVTFVTGMIPHHEQAVQMSGLVPQRSTNPAVVELAADIAGAQGPEIDTMKALLVQWDAGSAAGHDGHDTAPMAGMVDDPTMSKLASLRGAAFDELWLQSMIGHHRGAIAMAKTEIAEGANADAKALAQGIVTAQQTEIDQMTKMVTS